MGRKILALVAVLFLTAVPALAGGGEKGDWEVGPYGGFGWLDDYGRFQPKDDLLFGLRGGYFFTPHWNLELSWQRLDTETDLEILGVQDEDADLNALRLNLLYNFRPGGDIRPFVTAGVGCEKFDAHRFGDSSDKGFNAGGGLRWFLTQHFDIRLDGRFIRTRVGAGVDESQLNVEGTVGIGWVFGGEESPVTPEATPTPVTPEATPTPDTDSDGDGVYDRIDRCPNTPKGWPVDSWGCPLDSDGDGVPDGADRCPDTPREVKVDDVGCPFPAAKPPLIQILREKKAVVLEGVEFDNDRDTLRPASLTTLDEVAASLKDWSDVRLEVQGHCSSTGTAAHNMDLSQRRAAAVKAYLVTRGIDASRLEAKGYGETRPIANNSTEEGRQTNRRVELHVIE